MHSKILTQITQFHTCNTRNIQSHLRKDRCSSSIFPTAVQLTGELKQKIKIRKQRVTLWAEAANLMGSCIKIPSQCSTKSHVRSIRASRCSHQASRLQRSLAWRASLTEILNGMFHCWLNSGLVQNSYRQVKLKCRLSEGHWLSPASAFPREQPLGLPGHTWWEIVKFTPYTHTLTPATSWWLTT